jgi:hypothetical protein
LRGRGSLHSWRAVGDHLGWTLGSVCLGSHFA